MPLPRKAFLLPIRFPIDDPVLRVTVAGTAEDLELDITAYENYWMSVDGSTTEGQRDLAGTILLDALLTHSEGLASTFEVDLDELNFLTISCAATFTLHW